MATDVRVYTSPHLQSELVDSIRTRYSLATTTTVTKPAPPSTKVKPRSRASTIHTTTATPAGTGNTLHTLSPSPSAPRKPQPSLARRILNYVQLQYYRYEVTYGAYVMSPGEKIVMNGFILAVLGLLVWALFVYFPALLLKKVRTLDWLLTGRNDTVVGAAEIGWEGDVDAGAARVGVKAWWPGGMPSVKGIDTAMFRR